VAGKKTFLLIKTLEVANDAQRREMRDLERAPATEKVAGMLAIFRACGVDVWARELKAHYHDAACRNLEDIAVLSSRKEPLRALVDFLLERDF
jgi:geranylgeranyl diphosphate synthase type II